MMIKGEIQLVYISPENILCNLTSDNLRALVVHKAHYIKLWLVSVY